MWELQNRGDGAEVGNIRAPAPEPSANEHGGARTTFPVPFHHNTPYAGKAKDARKRFLGEESGSGKYLFAAPIIGDTMIKSHNT